jgi:hypothetical protein
MELVNAVPNALSGGELPGHHHSQFPKPLAGSAIPLACLSQTDFPLVQYWCKSDYTKAK